MKYWSIASELSKPNIELLPVSYFTETFHAGSVYFLLLVIWNVYFRNVNVWTKLLFDPGIEVTDEAWFFQVVFAQNEVRVYKFLFPHI